MRSTAASTCAWAVCRDVLTWSRTAGCKFAVRSGAASAWSCFESASRSLYARFAAIASLNSLQCNIGHKKWISNPGETQLDVIERTLSSFPPSHTTFSNSIYCVASRAPIVKTSSLSSATSRFMLPKLTPCATYNHSDKPLETETSRRGRGRHSG